MTHEEADKAQPWLGMDGAIAWQLIDRHADNWHEIGEMMNAWLRANVLAEREACAKVCEAHANERQILRVTKITDDPFGSVAIDCAELIRKRSNALAQGRPE